MDSAEMMRFLAGCLRETYGQFVLKVATLRDIRFDLRLWQ